MKISKIYKNSLFERIIPFPITIFTCGILIIAIYTEILLLNKVTPVMIYKTIYLRDVLIGMTIYLKTSVDFAIFIGNLMSVYPGWKNRISIEIGTAVGNAFGTIFILAIWDFFKEIKLLLAVMILLAALVLFKLAEESLEHITNSPDAKKQFKKIAHKLEKLLEPINNFFHIILRYIIPNTTMKPKHNLSFWQLFVLSLTIPFILGLDDFAGYVPLFDIVNVLGFAIGVLVGHMVLNIFLFVSPNTTIKVVKSQVIAFMGSIVFIGLALWGFFEVYKILFLHYQ